jgi:adenylate cyclase
MESRSNPTVMKPSKASRSRPVGAVQRAIVPLISFAALVVTCLYAWPVTRSLLERRERTALDEAHVSGKRTPAREDILVLGIDDASLKLDAAWPEDIEASPALQAMQKQWPWPRRAWAHILDRLFEAGAKQVFLDITFKSPSEDPENDRQLREALERHRGKVILGMKFEDSEVNGGTNTELMLPTTALTGTNPDTANTGLLTLWTDPDDRIRIVNWLMTASEAESKHLDTPAVPSPDEVTLRAVSHVLAGNINPQAAQLTDRSSRIRFSETDAYPPISLFQLFIPGMWEGNLANGKIFRDKTILIGAVASDLQDIQNTPIGRIPGVQVHSHALTALLSKSFIHQAPAWYRWVCIAGAALIAWLLVSFIRMPVLCVLSLVLVGIAGDWFGRISFDLFNLEVSSLPFTLALAACGIAGITGNFAMQLRESRKLQRFLARYTSPEFVDEMMTDRVGLYTTLGGVERTVTVFFSDVRGFTSMSEKMTPAQVVSQLNEYLSRMVACVFQHRGLVDKFIGDAVMALWGSTRFKPAEEGYKQDAINAVNAALAMRQALAELNADWRERGISELQFGMGIHQGDAIVGNIGSEAPYEKMDLTVIGDAVNLASRLESATKQYGVDLIVSAAVHRHLTETFLCRSADLVAVKGKTKPVEVFAVIGPISESAPLGLQAFERGVALYREGKFQEASVAFTEAASADLDDYLTHEYQDRCAELIANPPESWNGVYIMTKK